MALRFRTGWRRFVPFIGYHHVLMIFIAIAIVLLCEYTTTLAIFNPKADRLSQHSF
jgi:hypothetical protein